MLFDRYLRRVSVDRSWCSALLILTITAVSGCTPTAPAPSPGDLAQLRDRQEVEEYFRENGLSLPSQISVKTIKVTGGEGIKEAIILLGNESPSTEKRRRLVVLVHGWGGDR